MDDNQQPPPPPASVYPPPPPGSTPAPYHHHPLLHQQQLQQLKTFWTHQRTDIEQTNDFKNHQLPLARIKKIMKADEDVRMISAEAPILFAKACELFILELTVRSWLHAEENKRRTLQKNDIAAAITRTDIFDFLVDIVPREEVKEEEDVVGNVNVNVPYYYNPPPGGVYAQVPSQAWQSVWQNSGGGDDVSYGSGGSGNVDHQGPASKALDDRSSAKRPANVSRQEGSASSRSGEKDFQSLTVEKLRAFLFEKGLPTKGRKDELIARLKNAN